MMEEAECGQLVAQLVHAAEHTSWSSCAVVGIRATHLVCLPHLKLSVYVCMFRPNIIRI